MSSLALTVTLTESPERKTSTEESPASDCSLEFCGDHLGLLICAGSPSPLQKHHSLDSQLVVGCVIK